MMELIQFKLTSGEEVVAEVMEYPDQHMPEYVVRNAFSVRSMMNMEEEMSMSYGLSPWMMLQERSTDFILVNPSSIVSIAKPSDFMLREWNHAMTYTMKAHKERLKRKEDFDAEFLRRVEQYTQSLADEVAPTTDSATSNVINFPDPDTLH